MKGNNGRGLRLEHCIACIISFYVHSSYFLKPHACITSEDIKAILWLFPNQPGILKQKSKFKLVFEKFHPKEVLEKGPSMHIYLPLLYDLLLSLCPCLKTYALSLKPLKLNINYGYYYDQYYFHLQRLFYDILHI